MKTAASLALAFAFLGSGLVGCATEPKGPGEQQALRARADGSLGEMKAEDPGLNSFLSNAYGYAIFPSVGKGGFIVGGGYGRGEVYEQGRFVGFADITQATLGLQAGGQTFSQLIVFQNKEAADRFKYGKMKFAANVSAVALKAGAAASAKYSDGVAVFVKPQGGLMFEASVGGQEFGFTPAENAGEAPRTETRTETHTEMHDAGPTTQP